MTSQITKNIRLYCPNLSCPNHSLENLVFDKSNRIQRFYKIGKYWSKNRAAFACRFRCRICRTSFSSRVGLMDYRNQKVHLFEQVFSMFIDGLSNRQIARNLKVDETLVRNRLKRLCQQSFLNQAQRTRRNKIDEVISYDGVENFAKSQYEPNYINQAIGMKSLFIHDFNFSPLNRKGKMSDRQKLKKKKLELKFGKFPRRAIRTSTETILLRLDSKCKIGERLCLASDQHFQYRRAVEWDLKKKGIRIDHHTISAKAPRVFKHILFPVNHTDLLLRQQVKAFSRQTISFSKTHAAMIQKYALFMIWKNYMRPQFTKKHKNNPNSNTHTPAMAAGYENRVIEFRKFFGLRKMLSQVQMNSEWRDYHNGVVRNLRSLAA